MTGVVRDIAGSIAGGVVHQMIADALPDPQNGRRFTPMTHWSVKLLWGSVALSVAGFALALLSTSIPVVALFDPVLVPIFCGAFAATGIISAIGAYYLQQFIPERAFEEVVARKQLITTQLQNRVVELELQVQRMAGLESDLQRANARYEADIALVNQSNETLKSELGHVNDVCNALAIQNVMLKKSAGVLGKDAEQFDESNQVFSKELDGLSQQSQDGKEQILKFKAEIEKLQQEVQVFKVNKLALDETIHKLRIELQTSQKMPQKLAEENSALRVSINEVTAQLQAIHIEVESLQILVIQQQQQLESIAATNQALSKSNEDLRQNIALLSETAESFRASYTKIKEAAGVINRGTTALEVQTDALTQISTLVEEADLIARKLNQGITSLLQEVDARDVLVSELLSVKDDLPRLSAANELLGETVHSAAHIADELQKDNKEEMRALMKLRDSLKSESLANTAAALHEQAEKAKALLAGSQ